MSHYTQVKTQLKDQDALVEALKNLGYRPEVHLEAVHLVGYEGKQRPEVAHVIIRRSQLFGAANDLGFVKQPDGSFAAVTFDYRRDEQLRILREVTQQYGLVKATATLKQAGYAVGAPVRRTDGTIQFVAQRY